MKALSGITYCCQQLRDKGKVTKVMQLRVPDERFASSQLLIEGYTKGLFNPLPVVRASSRVRYAQPISHHSLSLRTLCSSSFRTFFGFGKSSIHVHLMSKEFGVRAYRQLRVLEFLRRGKVS